MFTGQLSGENSYDLIDEAIAAGRLTAEQGLIYKVYALFSDAQLPSEYLSNGTFFLDADKVMEDVIIQADSLSDSAEQALVPLVYLIKVYFSIQAE